MARTITPGRTWRDLPPSPPVGELPPEEAPPPPPEPPAPPERSGRGWWAALALALAAAVAVAAVWLWVDDSDAGEIAGQDGPPLLESDRESIEPGERFEDFLDEFEGEVPDALDDFLGQLPEGLDEFFEQFPEGLENLPDDLGRLLPPDLLGELENFFEGGELPDLLDRFDGDIPNFNPDELRRFFDEFGEALPNFDLEEFFADPDRFPFGGEDYSFEFGDGRFGLGYVPEGYRVAGSSAGASSQGGDLEAEITVQLAGPQGPVTIRAEVGGDAAAKLTDAPGEPVDVRGSEGKLSSEGLSFAEGDVFVTISPPGHLPDDELVRIADGLELGR